MKTLKYIVTITVALATTFGAWAQQGFDTEQAAKKYKKYREDSEKQLTDMQATQSAIDTTCYLLGVNCGLMVKSNGFFEEFSQMNMEKFMKGLTDAVAIGTPESEYTTDEEWAKKFEVSPYEMNNILSSFLAARSEYKAALNEKIGENFLAANAKNKKVKTTDSGLQYIIHKEGEGEKVERGEQVVVKYTGYLLDGTEFDSNDNIEFNSDRVIEGWSEGLCLLAKGGQATLFIPAELAYGKNAPRGSMIEPNSVLIFEIEVLDIIR